ncbi:hypothetical protein [Candidatus Nitrospira allomarina]|uniref:Uncharacterized protein n=1 Tax=Candidatus Nitrospira allomarina TaxID=3020900 RepID=A0AA96JS10_9BACT|nr:hypothetical protein [Candidatus Nitrospira allomarina]WNM57585.1 hypothetical protein PP769_16685 [Candidatus Nitrospira allomarina]
MKKERDVVHSPKGLGAVSHSRCILGSVYAGMEHVHIHTHTDPHHQYQHEKEVLGSRAHWHRHLPLQHDLGLIPFVVF